MRSIESAHARPLHPVRAAARALLDLVYPRDCASCGVRLPPDEHVCLCSDCLAGLPRISGDQCRRCGDQMGPYADGRFACRSCGTRRSLFFSATAAVCRYDDAARELVHRLKYGRDLRAADAMGSEMAARTLEAEWFGEVDLIVPVPLHWTRHLARRFNQSVLLARHIARASGKPLRVRALRRLRRTQSQTKFSGTQREENVRGVFGPASGKRLDGQIVLLVDDVMTTCATAAECARALNHAGAKRVYVSVFAR